MKNVNGLQNPRCLNVFYRTLGRQCIGLLVILLCIIAGFNAHAAETPQPNASPHTKAYPKRINFRDIFQNLDLALGEVEAIVQDHQGFIWLGGRNALLRYDGYEFLAVPVANDPNDLVKTAPVNHVLELLEDSDNTLWAATRAGLYRYDRNRELLLPVQNDQGTLLFREAIYALAESPAGELLVGTGSGLYIFNHKTAPVKSFDKMVNELFVDRQANLWVGTNEGMLKINWASKASLAYMPDAANPESVATNGILTIAEDADGTMWGGSISGIYRLNPVTGIFKHYQHDPKDPHSIPDNISRQIVVDKGGWVWTGSDSGGISIYDKPNDRFLRYSGKERRTGDLSSNTVRRIYEDRIGDMWIGTYPSGVNIYDRSTAAITLYQKDPDFTNGLLDNHVEAVEEDKAGNLWIGAGGVTRYSPGTRTFTHYRQTDGSDSRVESTSIMNGLIDSEGEIRFGTWAHGIQLYDKGKDRFIEVVADTTQVKRGEKTGRLLNDQMVWSVTEDSRHNLWIATHSNGLTKFDKKTGTYTFYPYDANDLTSISSTLVWTTFEDSKGRFWVGTANGLNLMNRDKGTFKRYMPDLKNPRSLANSSVLSILEDKKGRLWFGTDAGLHLYHPETDDFTIYDTRNGFIDRGIRVVVEDRSGNLWLGTNNGVVMFNPDTQLVRNYTRYNGALIGGISTGAGVSMKDGKIAFGARSGLYIFEPDELLINEAAPAVVLTDFRIFTQKIPINGADQILTKAINQTEQIILDHTKVMLSFNFAALNYRDPEKNQFAYKLEGFDDDWREVGNQRSALYTNLPAGQYRFHVKASNNDGVWNTEGRSIALTILPSPWKTWLAYCIYFLMGFALLVFFVHTQRKEVLHERKANRKLELKVSERTVELQNKNSELAERTAELQNKNSELEKAYAQLEGISFSDPLTGLSNRRYLQKLMPMDVAKVQRGHDAAFSGRPQRKESLDITFFIMDVDFFKSVNDMHGHAAGDNLLIQISELLKQVCRASDCLIRWGGEEFVIVSRFAGRDEAPMMAERIRKSIEGHPFKISNETILHKTCSIGFACFPFLPDHPMELSWEHVIDIADHALYAAKRSGRNRSVGLAANSNTKEAQLYRRISGNLKEMIENNELTIISEKPTDLIWD